MKIQRNIRELLVIQRDGDACGFALTSLFSICATLYLRNKYVPTEWQYRPSQIMTELCERGDYTTENLLDYYDDGTINADDLRHAGSVLVRYSNFVKLAGRDY